MITVVVDNSPDLGTSSPRSGCEGTCGSPINLTNGNTWIKEDDYSLPGLGGGLGLSRTWNSLWPLNFPFQQVGMFGDSWQSNYEEFLQVLPNSLVKYWRGDGSAWQFSFNKKSGYTLTSPPDERATLTSNSRTGLSTLTFRDGSQKTFNSAGYLTAVLDRNGNQTTLTYNAANRVTAATDAAGRTLTFIYGNPSFPNQVSSIQDSVGTIATYSYAAGGFLASVTYADNSAVNFTYDSNGLIISVTDANGKTLESHTYDGTRRGLTSVRANGIDQLTASYTYTTRPTLTASNGNVTTYGVQGIGLRNYVSSISGSGCDSCAGRGNSSFTYDSLGNRLTSTDPLGHLTKFSYDANGNVTQTQIQSDSTGSNFQIWNNTYNSFGEVLTAQDPLGNTTTNTYDAKGNLLSTTTPSPNGSTPGSKTTFTYDTKGELLTITDPDLNKTTLTYWPTGLIKSITDTQNNITQFQYDARGNRTAVIDANNQTTSFTYDVMNRLIKITYPTTPATYSQFAYDYRGRRTSATDPNGQITHYAYDDADRLTSVTDANNPAGVTQYGYDNENNLTSVMDAASHQTTFQYDPFGHVTKTTFPSSLSESYAYDLDDNLVTKTDRNNHTINYAYDTLNRLNKKTYPDNTTVNYIYDLANRLTQVTDSTGAYGFSYDNMGRLTGTTTQYSFLTGKTFSSAYAYDAASNRTSLTLPDGSNDTYLYDTLNRLKSLTDSITGQFNFGYDTLSRRTSLTRPNGVNTSYGYDSLSRLLSVLHKSGTNTLDGASYTYDNAGNRTAKTNSLNSVTEQYTYDPLYQLKQVAQGTTTTESYNYDSVGNRLSSLGVPSYSYNSSNELTANSAATFTYDNNGNTLTKTDSTGTRTYGWDFENRLTSVALPGSGGTVMFKYDPFGRRVQKSSSSGTTNYLYDGANAIEDVDQNGNVLARYTQGGGIDEPLAETRSGATSYYEQDGLGSITALSNSTGALANTYTYDAFGNLTASTGALGNPFQYNGHDYDPETGLRYYRARYYDPQTGRFLTEDPLEFAGGGANFYGYVGNRPTNSIDPSGRSGQNPVSAWWSGIGRNANFAWNWFWETDNFGDATHIQFHGKDFLYYGTNTPESQDMMNSAGGAYMRLLYRFKYKCTGSPQNSNFPTWAGYLFTTQDPSNTAFQVGAFSFDIEDMGDGTVQYTMYNKAGWYSLLGGLNRGKGDHDRQPAVPMHEVTQFWRERSSNVPVEGAKAMRLRKEVAASVLIVALLAALQLVGCGVQGRIRAEHSQIVGSYVTKLANGSERLELKGDGTYVQDVISQSRPLHHTGQWRVENRFLSGSDVILTNAAVSEEKEELPLKFGNLTLNVHDRSGKLVLARNEAADWYFERAH